MTHSDYILSAIAGAMLFGAKIVWDYLHAPAAGCSATRPVTAISQKGKHGRQNWRQRLSRRRSGGTEQ